MFCDPARPGGPARHDIDKRYIGMGGVLFQDHPPHTCTAAAFSRTVAAAAVVATAAAVVAAAVAAAARRLTLHHYRWALPVAIHIVMHTIAIAIVDVVTSAPTLFGTC